jgi:hypothetical protein
MVKRVIQELIDDIDGKAADETILFSLDGVQYQIDLSKRNAAKFRSSLEPFVSAGTKLGRASALGGRSRDGRRRGGARSDRDQTRAIREWAHAKGIEVSDRGRIKQEIVDRYHAEAGR